MIQGIPASALLAAAKLPENRASRALLERAAGVSAPETSPTPPEPPFVPHASSDAVERVQEGIASGESSGYLLVTLPLPPKALSPNARVHWAKKARAVKEYRALAGRAAFVLHGPHWEHATVQATFYFSDRRKRDPDNLLASLKSALDGLADAGVVADDSGLTHFPVRMEVDRERPRVELAIRPSCGPVAPAVIVPERDSPDARERK